MATSVSRFFAQFVERLKPEKVPAAEGGPVAEVGPIAEAGKASVQMMDAAAHPAPQQPIVEPDVVAPVVESDVAQPVAEPPVPAAPLSPADAAKARATAAEEAAIDAQIAAAEARQAAEYEQIAIAEAERAAEQARLTREQRAVEAAAAARDAEIAAELALAEAQSAAEQAAEVERLEAERIEAERIEAERLAAERAEAERLAAEEAAEAERAEAERVAAEEASRLVAQDAEATAADNVEGDAPASSQEESADAEPDAEPVKAADSEPSEAHGAALAEAAAPEPAEAAGIDPVEQSKPEASAAAPSPAPALPSDITTFVPFDEKASDDLASGAWMSGLGAPAVPPAAAPATARVEASGLFPPASALATLEGRNISAWFGDHQVLDRVSLTMEAGIITSLIGPSGCGKSTFLRILNRMHELVPSASLAGEVLLDGDDIYDPARKLVEARKQIGMVFQKPNPFPAQSIYDNVIAGLSLTGTRASRDEKDALVESCLTKAGLWKEVKDRLRAPGAGLSGGQQQRLCIARSLAVRPRVLLMDEPCSALDPTSTRVIEETMLELAHEVTIVIVTHNMQQAQRVSQQCAFFLASHGTPGAIVEHGDTDAMFGDPIDPRTYDYVNGRFG